VVCALHAVTELGLQSSTAIVLGHLRSRHPIVRETALSALSVLVPAPTFIERCAGLKDDSHRAVSRAATHLLASAAAAS